MHTSSPHPNTPATRVKSPMKEHREGFHETKRHNSAPLPKEKIRPAQPPLYPLISSAFWPGVSPLVPAQQPFSRPGEGDGRSGHGLGAGDPRDVPPHAGPRLLSSLDARLSGSCFRLESLAPHPRGHYRAAAETMPTLAPSVGAPFGSPAAESSFCPAGAGGDGLSPAPALSFSACSLACSAIFALNMAMNEPSLANGSLTAGFWLAATSVPLSALGALPEGRASFGLSAMAVRWGRQTQLLARRGVVDALPSGSGFDGGGEGEGVSSHTLSGRPRADKSLHVAHLFFPLFKNLFKVRGFQTFCSLSESRKVSSLSFLLILFDVKRQNLQEKSPSRTRGGAERTRVHGRPGHHGS